MTRTPYFSLEGAAFQTAGDDNVVVMNTRAAMKAVEDYILRGASNQDTDTALRYLHDTHVGLRLACMEIWKTFFLDDFLDSELKRRICTRAYNVMVDRLNAGQAKRR